MTPLACYTPSEIRLRGLLSDGEPHSIAEIKRMLGDPCMEDSAVMVHISNLRAKMRDIERGYIITTESARECRAHLYYRLRRRIQQ